MQNRFSQVMSEIERDIGTRDMNLLILSALRESLFTCRLLTLEALKTQMEEVIHIVNNTEPRYAIVIYNLHNLYDKMRAIIAKTHGSHPYCDYKPQLIKVIDDLIEKTEKDLRRLLKNAEKIKVENKTILIHDHSHTVQQVLAHLKKKRKKFRVLIAEQDMEKTLSNIESLTQSEIPFQVIPAHMLSNVENEVDLCFFGAMTFKSTHDFVVDTGTNAIISEFHLKRTPIYIFLSASKFSLWQSKKKEKISHRLHTRNHPSKKIQFSRYKFSHDRVPLANVSYTVTEEGIFTPAELKPLYAQKYKANATLIREIEKI